jgi:hypothetical protein
MNVKSAITPFFAFQKFRDRLSLWKCNFQSRNSLSALKTTISLEDLGARVRLLSSLIPALRFSTSHQSQGVQVPHAYLPNRINSYLPA